jgi:hypothetical protein
MRKRYTRKYRHWSPRWKWGHKREYVALIEFEREWKGWRGSRKNPPDGPKG